jgi:DNA-directed RNA polymerase specialized sigma24 family protein
MKFSYRKAYLTDGTQVKITEELFRQLVEWEKEGREFHFSYIDLLKNLDNEMINGNRKYYSHNTSLEEILDKELTNPKILFNSRLEENYVGRRIEMNDTILMVLNLCTEAQKRRFFKYYYLDFRLEKIAKQDNCSVVAVYNSIKKVEKKLINLKKFF